MKKLDDTTWARLEGALTRHPLLVLRALREILTCDLTGRERKLAEPLLNRVGPPLFEAMRARSESDVPIMDLGATEDELRRAARILKEQRP